MDDLRCRSEVRFEPNEYPLGQGLRLLEASAGTGKTFALAHLVLRLVTERTVNIKEILVVTFTEAAAAELKARICNRLEQALEGLESFEGGIDYTYPDEVLKVWLETSRKNTSQRISYIQLLLEALEGLDFVDITTIHGFCSRTLQKDALYSSAGVDPVLEGDGQEIIFEVVNDYWNQKILTLDPDDLRGFYDAGLNIDTLSESLLRLDNDPSMTLNDDDLTFNNSCQFEVEFKDYLETCLKNFLDLWRLEGQKLEEDLCRQAQEWRSLGCDNTKPFSSKPRKNRFEIVNNWAETFFENRDLDQRGLDISYGFIRDQTLLRNYFHPAIFCDTARRCGEDFPKLIHPLLQKSISALVDSPAEKVWTHSLHFCLKTLEERRHRQGVISYGGLLRAVENGLRDSFTCNPEIKKQNKWLKTIQLRYKVALIDEFQDTDPLQWQILRRLFGTSQDHLLLMVGDPKQAIYRFRGGDLNVYLEARANVDRIDVLLDNFRATPTLMSGLNCFMANGLRVSNLPIPSLNSCGKDDPIRLNKGEYPLQLITLESFDSGKNNLSSKLLSKTRIEEFIPEVVANSVLDLLDRHKGELKPDDFCILVSRHDQASAIRSAMSSVGLPTRLVSSGDVFQTEGAELLQCFMDCIAKPTDTACLRLLACSALFQWNVSRLEASEMSGELDELAERFSDLSQNFSHLGLLGCLADSLKGQTIANLSEQGRLLGDLQQCAQLVQENIHSRSLDPLSAAIWFRRERLQPKAHIPDNRQPHSDLADKAVSVVTVHRSKGLEYRVVLCPYLWQAPPHERNPLLRDAEGPCWRLALSHGWGQGRIISQQNSIASIQEAERIAYVAMTRARSMLILFWARGLGQDDNPLKNFLHSPCDNKASNEKLSIAQMRAWLLTNKVPITIYEARANYHNRRWVDQEIKGELSLGPIPSKSLDTSWGRSSYSAWISGKDSVVNAESLDPFVIEVGRDTQQEKSDLSDSFELMDDVLENSCKSEWSTKGPLFDFPRGAVPGDCLHRILEKVDFCRALDASSTAQLITTELSRAGLEKELLSSVQNGLEMVFNTPLGGPLGGLKFKHLTKKRRIHEMSFDLPIAQNGKLVSSDDLADAFRQGSSARFSTNYADILSKLQISSKGFFTGSIDLVFTDNDDLAKARWWVVDWKSNWIGERDGEGNCQACGPFHYTNTAMEKQMLRHHYPLQANLYLVALHRFLRWRLPSYVPLRHLGGYIYAFIRGMPGEVAVSKQSPNNFIPGLIVETTSLERVLALDRLLEQGGR